MVTVRYCTYVRISVAVLYNAVNYCGTLLLIANFFCVCFCSYFAAAHLLLGLQGSSHQMIQEIKTVA